MSGIERSRSRIKETSEIFTPTELVQEILNQLPEELFKDSTKTFCDPSCGDGQFLSEILIRKIQNGIKLETALSTIYGVDIMEDNVNLCRKRLLCNNYNLQYIVNKNIICADGLTYNYLFGEKETIVKNILEF